MDGYGININMRGAGASRYRAGGEEAWDLTEACAMAHDLLHEREARYVTVGNGEHEFRMWGDSPGDLQFFKQTDTGPRWSDWYVDVRIGEHRWQYQPVADISDQDAAVDLVVEARKLDEVDRVWAGASDGTEEYEYEQQES
jgi:hypothetical protein